MRITGGKYKNKKIITEIKGIPKERFRPITSKIKESVFNILQNYTLNEINSMPNGAIVADLFCGCGNFGIEAISRGAKHVFFANNSQNQIQILKHNIKNLNEEHSADYLVCDITSRLPKINQKCNLVYMDPPYHKNMITQSLFSLQESDWLSPQNIIIAEMIQNEEPEIPNAFKLIDQRQYGKTKLLFLKYNFT